MTKSYLSSVSDAVSDVLIDVWEKVIALPPTTRVLALASLVGTSAALKYLFSKDQKVAHTYKQVGKWIMVTGCDSGIGYETSLSLFKSGFSVVACCLTAEGCERLRQEGGRTTSSLEIVKADLSNPRDVEDLCRCLQIKCKGELWGLVNNAGIFRPGFCDLAGMEDFRDSMEVNFFSHVAVTKICLPMLKRVRGRIINITSSWGLVSIPGFAPYTCSNFALEAFSDALRREMKPYGVKVSLIEPGTTKTPMGSSVPAAFQKSFAACSERERAMYGQEWLDTYLEIVKVTASQGAQDVSSIVAQIEHAVTSPAPRTRYRPGMDSQVFLLLSMLPAPWTDQLLSLDSIMAPPAGAHGKAAAQKTFLADLWIRMMRSPKQSSGPGFPLPPPPPPSSPRR